MIRIGVMACIVALLGWHAHAVGQPRAADAITTAADPQAIADDSEPAELEPITVTGQRTRRAVQREMYAVQDQAYQLFNDLNTDDDYDIICQTERPRGAKYTHRVCKARFHREAEARASIDYMNAQKGGFGVYFVNRPEIDHKYEHHRELMAELAHNNPEFLELLEKQYELRQEFEAKGGIVRSAIGSSE